MIEMETGKQSHPTKTLDYRKLLLVSPPSPQLWACLLVNKILLLIVSSPPSDISPCLGLIEMNVIYHDVLELLIDMISILTVHLPFVKSCLL